MQGKEYIFYELAELGDFHQKSNRFCTFDGRPQVQFNHKQAYLFVLKVDIISKMCYTLIVGFSKA